jgi:polysaccharide deacetylase family sporulation protein PdaB
MERSSPLTTGVMNAPAEARAAHLSSHALPSESQRDSIFYTPSLCICIRGNNREKGDLMVFFHILSKWRMLLIIACVAFLSSFAVALFGNATADVGISAISAVSTGGRLVPIYSVARDDKVVSVTVDATWGDDKTLALLDLFDKHQIKVTFFLAGHWIKSYPEMVKTIAARGHEVGNHSWTHPHMGSLSPAQIKQELELTQSALCELTGSRPTVFRPPFGEYTNSVINMAEECGCQTIQWSVDSLDWKDLTQDQIYDRVMKRVGPGSIILFHNAGKHTPEALDRIIRDLKAEGYTMIPVSELIYTTDYHIDRNTGEQRPVRVRTPAESESSSQISLDTEPSSG